MQVATYLARVKPRGIDILENYSLFYSNQTYILIDQTHMDL